MGQEIDSSHFYRTDFHQFERRLAREMALLHCLFAEEQFDDGPLRIGLELELWLISENGRPQPRNAELLELVNHPDVVPELSRFNIELNVPPQRLSGQAIRRMEEDLSSRLKLTGSKAAELGLALWAGGTLPTLNAQDLSLQTMSELKRYRALNEQILRLRRGRPIRLRIEGTETLDLLHHDVMLEAAATSLQVHYQVPQRESVRYFNAAVLATAPALGVSVNSPCLFGKCLWDETRIPLFEKAVDLSGPFPRVHLGSGYAHESLEEFFLENRSCHSVLLPIVLDEADEKLAHVRLHNGTIWRWNRPLIGISENHRPHLRVEFRALPAGPSLIDMMANVAFATGLIHSLAQREVAPESQIVFEVAEGNFQAAAKDGLGAQIQWMDQKTWLLRDLVLEELLPAVAQSLNLLKIDPIDAERYLSVIDQRVRSGQTGATWQRNFIQSHGREMGLLTREYQQRQNSGEPVHLWLL